MVKALQSVIASLILAAVSLFATGQVYAASVTTDSGGKATGIDGLHVGGAYYDVDFVGFNQSYDTVFGGAFDITDSGLATDIMAAIIGELNAALPGGVAEWSRERST